MARTPLLRSLVRIARDHQEADRRGIPVDQVHEERSAGRETDGSSGVRISRRDLLVGGAATVAAAMLPASLVRARGGSGTVRVAIIGGGLAGLSAALVLADNGIPSTIYEAMDTICGRTRSTRPGKPGCGNCHAVSSRPYGDLWADGQITDIFGELIDTGHTQMQALAQRFHLPLIDLLESEPAGSTETYRFLGDYYTKAEADADFGWLYQNAIKPDLHAAGYQTTWEATRGQGGSHGILVDYTGGSVTDAMSLRHPYGDYRDSRVLQGADTFLTRIEPVFPGLSAFWNGRCEAAMPHTNPYWNSSYSYWKVGQYQTIAGYESVRQGNILFAGEHTSLDFQGWMEGAAREGARAGVELARELRRSVSSGVGVSRREAIGYWGRKTRRTAV